MKLKDLKQGMVCELRNGNTHTILNNNADRNCYNDGLDTIITLRYNYKDDLTHQTQSQKHYDIMKVTFGNDVIYERQENNLFFEPEKDEDYHFVKYAGGVLSYENDETEYDDAILKTNIVFKTREEAEKELLRQQAKIRVIKEIARLNDGWDVREHWGNDDVLKIYITYNYGDSEIVIAYNRVNKVVDNNLYLKTRELAEQLIKTHSDDLKLMLEVE